MPMSPHPPLFGGASAPGVRTFGGEGSQISSTDGSGSSDAHKRGYGSSPMVKFSLIISAKE